jgi:protein SCO1/2/putative membrane protein
MRNQFSIFNLQFSVFNFLWKRPPLPPLAKGGRNTSRALRPQYFSRIALTVVTSIALLGLACVARADDAQPLWDPEGIEDFSLTECHGQTVTKADLLGKPWVACFIFTRCAGPCPRVSQQMRVLQDRLKGLDVRLVSFSVDPENDTPEVLRDYAKSYKVDPARWWFLTGNKDVIFHLILNSFRVRVEDDPRRPPGNEVIHSTMLMYVDAAGVVRARFDAQDDVDMAKLRRLLLGKSDATDARLIKEAEEEERRQRRAMELATADPQFRSSAAEQYSDGAQVPDWVVRLPAVNASLNALATVLLVAGWTLIKAGKPRAHKLVMMTAFNVSALFLACYLLYHFQLHHYTGSGSRKFAGEGAIRMVYFPLLISHILLAFAVAILAPMTIYRALTDQFERHKRLARITFPIWLYVSVTGVIIYFLLYHWPSTPV